MRDALPADAAAWIANLNAVGAEGRYVMTEVFARTREEIETQFKETDPTHQLWLVAEVDGRVIGGANASRGRHSKNAHSAELGVSVLREYRGLGIGQALMEAIIAWGRELGLAKIRLGVFATNAPAIGLYEKLGFREEGRLRKEVRIDGAYVDEVLMALWLRSV